MKKIVNLLVTGNKKVIKLWIITLQFQLKKQSKQTNKQANRQTK